MAGSHGTDQSVFFQNRPVLGLDQFDRFEAHGRGVLGQFVEFHFETPHTHRLIEPAFEYGFFAFGRRLVFAPDGLRNGQRARRQ